jgi:hypothetical protein
VKKIKIVIASLLLATSTIVSADEDNGLSNLYVGLQGASFSSGLSVKYAFTEKFKAQAILGAIGTVTSYSGRGIYSFHEDKYFDYYGLVGVGVWNWSNRYYNESVLGYSIGVGAEYDLRKAVPDFPAFFVSGEVAFSYIGFDNYSYGGVGLGLGLHYKF